MMRTYRWIFMTITVLLLASCSGISSQVKQEAVPTPEFDTLVDEAGKYEGDTVILGGYVLETKVGEKQTTLELLQAPLSSLDKPKSRDLARGRVMVVSDDYLEPEVYTKGRRVTAAGVLEECSRDPIPTCRLKAREVHLWPEYPQRAPYYYYDPFYDPFYYPYYYGPWRHPFGWRYW